MKLLLLDCDSTLSSLEGIDELGRARGPEVFARIEEMTRQAMEGLLPVEGVFGRRLDIIRPTREHVEAVGRRYVETVEPTAAELISQARALGWMPIIVSGGFRQAIQPLAGVLGITRIEAVDLVFGPDGSYRGYDAAYPTTRSGGKPEVVHKLINELRPSRIVMVGDGVSDLETRDHVDLFVGFGRYVAREKVRAGAQAFVTSLSDVAPLLRALR